MDKQYEENTKSLFCPSVSRCLNAFLQPPPPAGARHIDLRETLLSCPSCCSMCRAPRLGRSCVSFLGELGLDLVDKAASSPQPQPRGRKPPAQVTQLPLQGACSQLSGVSKAQQRRKISAAPGVSAAGPLAAGRAESLHLLIEKLVQGPVTWQVVTRVAVQRLIWERGRAEKLRDKF